ncbi:MAG: TonB-dependent receptor, partial [Bacteroidia bacterium]|nr:TonB-dependent receptor [Bacteroidia bacterium]
VLTGILLEEENIPLGYATVVLLSRVDSSIVDNTLSDPDRSFSLSAAPGAYYMEISFIGYEDKFISDIDLTADNLDYNLGKIMMETDAIAIDEVLIRAERSQMEFKLDKRVFNVGKDLTNAGNTAADILDNVPSVNVDAEGNVSLRGSQGVRILIDGKPSGLISAGNTDALLRMQGDIIQSVEVITNPSARYEAEGEAGIINIILKKNKEKGVNGSFGLTAGFPSNFGSSYNLNMRRESFNFFSNFGLDYRKAPGGGFSTQQFLDEGIQSNLFTTDTDQERGGLGGYIQLGSDWNIDENNLLTGSFLYRGGDSDNLSTVLYRDFGADQNVLQTTTREIIENEKDHNIEASLDFTRKFKREDQEFNFTFKYILNEDTEIADYNQSSNNALLSLNQNSDNTEDEENILIQADYVQPWGNTGKIETGVRAALRNVRNNFLVEEDVDGQKSTIPGFDDELQYDENIYAIYLNGANEFGNLSIQGGVRAELSDIRASLVRSENENIQDYLNLFPSATLSYKLSETNQLQLSYSKRLSRPYFRRLLPFSNFNDPRSIRLGNPGLRPEFTDSYELGYLKYFEKGTLLTNVYFRSTEGVIQTLTMPSEDGTTIRFPVNLSSRNSYGLEFNYSYDLTADWDITTDLNFFKSTLKGTYEGKTYDAETFSWSGRINSKFDIGKQSQIQVSMNYRGPENTAQGRRLYSASLNLAASKDVFSGKGSVTLSIRDLLNTRKWRWRVDLPDYIAESEFQWRQARSVVLTFNYRLNQQTR